MLQFLKIQNLALLDQVVLEFEEGFVAVTGETGAGKSILLGAISLLAGGRADRTSIRQGTETCEVEAELFIEDPTELNRVLENCGLPACEDGTLLLRRQFSQKKAARVTVNGSLATVANLQAIGALWVDFHGPNEPRRLLKSDAQIELLDAFGRLEKEVTAYSTHYRTWRDVQAEIVRLSGEERLAPDQVTDELVHHLIRLEPHGVGNPEPVFQMDRLEVAQWRLVGRDHLQRRRLLRRPLA